MPTTITEDQIRDGHIRRYHLHAELAGSERVQMTGNRILTASSTCYQFLDPNGNDRDVTLPMSALGLSFVIKNIGSANTLTIKLPGGATLVVLGFGTASHFYYEGTDWQVF